MLRNIMRKNIVLLKKIVFAILTLGCVVYHSNDVQAQAKQSEVSSISLAEHLEYSDRDLLELVKAMGDELEVENIQDFVIGKEVDCFNLDTKDVVRYVPILCKNKCVFLAVIETGGTLSISNDIEFYQNFLNKCVKNETYLFYIVDDRIYASSRDKTFLLDTFSKQEKKGELNSFQKYNFTEKIKYIKKEFDCKLRNTVSDEDSIQLGNLENDNTILSNSQMTGSSAASTTESNRCGITNFVKQISNTCWAASVATIVNYKKNKNLTVYDICNKMGISVYEGANLIETRDALNSYGLLYHIKEAYLVWGYICKNIDKDKPFCMALQTAKKEGHIVTGYGYISSSNGTKKIVVWDPNGSIRIVEYKSDKTAMTIDGKSFVWVATLY
ncbi:MAG: hypothetical protein K2N51_15380 [Lachnospiraceae bacterium]|nr:hypothetical protein [Lachnospiraceae bacterium]